MAPTPSPQVVINEQSLGMIGKNHKFFEMPPLVKISVICYFPIVVHYNKLLHGGVSQKLVLLRGKPQQCTMQ